MTHYTVRHAILSDVAQFADVEISACALFRAIPDLAWIAGSEPTSEQEHVTLMKSGTVWAALDDTNLVAGFLLAEVGGSDLHICELAVHSVHQRRGVGARLIDAAALHARQNGLSALTLTTFTNVPWNAPYYARLGFVAVDEADFDRRLRDVFAREVRIGLPVEQRCAMRRVL